MRSKTVLLGCLAQNAKNTTAKRGRAGCGLDPGPGIGQAEEMLGIVNLNRIDIRNPADGVPERKLEE